MHKRTRSWAATVAVTMAAVCLSAGTASSASSPPTTPTAITITTSSSQPLQLLPDVRLTLAAPQQWQVGQRASLRITVTNDSNLSYYNGLLRVEVPTALADVTLATHTSLDSNAATKDRGVPDASYVRSDGTTVHVWRNAQDSR